MAVLGGPHCRSGFSLVAKSRGCSLAVVRGLLVAAASFVEHGLDGMWALIVVAPGLWSTVSAVVGARSQQWWVHGLSSLQHVGSPEVRDRTCVSCIGRRILYH